MWLLKATVRGAEPLISWSCRPGVCEDHHIRGLRYADVRHDPANLESNYAVFKTVQTPRFAASYDGVRLERGKRVNGLLPTK